MNNSGTVTQLECVTQEEEDRRRKDGPRPPTSPTPAQAKPREWWWPNQSIARSPVRGHEGVMEGRHAHTPNLISISATDGRKDIDGAAAGLKEIQARRKGKAAAEPAPVGRSLGVL